MLKKTILILGILLSVVPICAQSSRWSVSDEGGLSRLTFHLDGKPRNIIDANDILGHVKAVLSVDGNCIEFNSRTSSFRTEISGEDHVQFACELAHDVFLKEIFTLAGDNGVEWTFRIENKNDIPVRVTDFGFRLPVLSLDKSIPATDNYCRHHSINGHSSFLYWNLYSGKGDKLILVPVGNTSLEYADIGNIYWFNSTTVVDREKDTWGLPSSSRLIKPHSSISYKMKFSKVNGDIPLEDALYANGTVNVRVVPGMTVQRGEEIQFALRGLSSNYRIRPEFKNSTRLESDGRRAGFTRFKVVFDRLGENTLTVNYGKKRMYLEFFVTEPIETLIRKRSAFIVKKQQHRNPDKWYDGLYSLYNMESDILYSPESYGELNEFMVGGSDDPSNSKPVFVSEKNVVFPDSAEVASLLYYEKNFVWGKLQRTDEEYPYPYGIYGSENWYQNRSGNYGGYGSGGWGKERMWRTFDYTTHFAIYYNLYLIAKQNPLWMDGLDADIWLNRAYHTAMAYFEVPYNILMGEKWAFHGWCDWAYKQGNFHERYILDIIDALESEGRSEEASKLRREWEKKVTYMIYENPWPFGSEMFVDRTAFESSYYVGEYALKVPMVPQEQFWYDKNEGKWYSYTSYPQKPKDEFMLNQLNANLALRGIYEPGYHSLGTAWGGGTTTLDYMCQMGGTAILDYAVRFSECPADYVRYGYNSLLSSWALINSGDEDSDYGYWHKGIQADGAAGWAYSYYQKSHPYMRRLDVPRGPWRWDGEIDHGFTGAVHGAGTYVLEDPVFGNICYGGRLDMDKDVFEVISNDGVRRHFAFPDCNRFEMFLKADGVKDGELSLARNLERICFTIESRSKASHVCAVELWNLPSGTYKLIYGENQKSFTATGYKTLVEIPIDSTCINVEIIKIK